MAFTFHQKLSFWNIERTLQRLKTCQKKRLNDHNVSGTTGTPTLQKREQRDHRTWRTTISAGQCLLPVTEMLHA